MTIFKAQTSSQSFALMFLVQTRREPEDSSWSSLTLNWLSLRNTERPLDRVRLLPESIGSLRKDDGNDNHVAHQSKTLRLLPIYRSMIDAGVLSLAPAAALKGSE